MFERFNFYDIYGNLVPGIVLVGLLYAPFGLLFYAWPNQDFSTAVVALVFAYVIGHVVQGFSGRLMPSTIPDKQGNPRHPSDLVIDYADFTFTKETKKKIDCLSQKYFGLNLGSEESLGPRFRKAVEERDKFEEDSAPSRARLKLEGEELKKQEQFLADDERERRYRNLAESAAQIKKSEEPISAAERAVFEIVNNRNDAFFLARSTLLRDKVSSYWEQFEGLYALMRAVTAAFAFASAYFLGWFIILWLRGPVPVPQPGPWKGVAAALLLFFLLKTLVFSVAPKARTEGHRDEDGHESKKEKREKEEITLWSFRVSVLCVGFLAGMLLAMHTSYPSADDKHTGVKIDPALVLFFMGLLGMVAAVRCHGAFKAFAREFAMAVWRDFANLEEKWSRDKSGASSEGPSSKSCDSSNDKFITV